MSGGSLPGELGAELVREIEIALGAREDVVIYRNPVLVARAPSGRPILTGIGGEGAPDLHAEVRVGALWVCVWLECKAGSGVLNPKQKQWHKAALARGRHVVTVRSVADAEQAIRELQEGVS